MGTEYLVYALTIRRGQVWYYVLDERRLGYPIWHPAMLFDVVDGRISRHWLFAMPEQGVRDGDVLFAFPEWTRDPVGYYDQLSNGDAKALGVFDRFRALMDLEFAGDVDRLLAEALGDGWIMCPQCKEAWQTTATGELLRCPECGTILRNPRFAHLKDTRDGVGQPNP